MLSYRTLNINHAEGLYDEVCNIDEQTSRLAFQEIIDDINSDLGGIMEATHYLLTGNQVLSITRNDQVILSSKEAQGVPDQLVKGISLRSNIYSNVLLPSCRECLELVMTDYIINNVTHTHKHCFPWLISTTSTTITRIKMCPICSERMKLFGLLSLQNESINDDDVHNVPSMSSSSTLYYYYY
ncbi:hypothetical protein BDC45DRAFT_534141 [Circinella umbellata]|nr:hypothetical protein BDC45DRAFT_534141 [Circinella umbellata]